MIISYFVILFLIIIPVIWYILRLLLLKPKKKKRDSNFGHNVSIILTCYNEEKKIKNKIIQLLKASSILKCQFEIIIVSDGSNDKTNTIIESLVKQYNLKKIIIHERKGKANAINIGVLNAIYPLLIFSDVRQTISKFDLVKLVSHFSNSEIGAVSSLLVHKKEKLGFRRILNQLKIYESALNSTIGVCGGLYAVRKECVKKLPLNTILDDLLISLFVIQTGKRVIVDKDVTISDIEIKDYYTKERVLRTICGLVQIISCNWKLLSKINPLFLVNLHVKKYLKLVVVLTFIILTILAFSSMQLFLFHMAIVLMLILGLIYLGVFNLVLRMTKILLYSIIDIKKYNTNLWIKVE